MFPCSTFLIHLMCNIIHLWSCTTVWPLQGENEVKLGLLNQLHNVSILFFNKTYSTWSDIVLRNKGKKRSSRKCKDSPAWTWADPGWCVVYLADVQTLILAGRTPPGDRGGRQMSEPMRGSKTPGNKLHSQPPTQPQTFPRKCLYWADKLSLEQRLLLFISLS